MAFCLHLRWNCWMSCQREQSSHTHVPWLSSRGSYHWLSTGLCVYDRNKFNYKKNKGKCWLRYAFVTLSMPISVSRQDNDISLWKKDLSIIVERKINRSHSKLWQSRFFSGKVHWKWAELKRVFQSLISKFQNLANT